MSERGRQKRKEQKLARRDERASDVEPNWDGKCENCGEGPTVGNTGMCGPCCFGDASTIGGNW